MAEDSRDFLHVLTRELVAAASFAVRNSFLASLFFDPPFGASEDFGYLGGQEDNEIIIEWSGVGCHDGSPRGRH
ncbi:hypothetical protein [Actinoplanes sp. ATCC 53533]|uniref:hypothetical protein n=1 Tax=Actinoplanes sp. ATCC 53533 TaxID=1288362 RepID=UPI001F2A12B7|nr:hypothetical protein [Actinoplanes sp. ATCC 53533]